MRILLVSTYELGHQPIHLASPMAALKQSGHDVVGLDLSVDEADLSILDGVDAVAFSVPMHTAMRLAISTATRIKASNPDLPVAFYGLYADVGRERTLGTVTDAIFCGEYEKGLAAWASSLASDAVSTSVQVYLGKTNFNLPLREGLPPLESYARMEFEGMAKITGAVEASHGCRHRCRHCPIPAVYDGRLRIVGEDLVVADIAQLVEAGAEHITFADADFLNAPAYSMAVLRRAHGEFPELTFDITVKVEHIIEHRELWEEMSTLNVLFVISAFESVDNTTLDILDKGHTVEDMIEAARITADAGIYLRPTWLPFLPWTTPSQIADLVGFLDANGLASSLDPVQLSIKLLLPEGSLLLTQPDVSRHLRHFDPDALTWFWEFEDPDTARLHKELDRIAADASDCQQDAADTLALMRQAISEVSGVHLGPQPVGSGVPRLSESWFCCAEPTAGQASAVASVSWGGPVG